MTLDEVVALCKRRGFIFQSSEIYGGLGSTYDYGHYGVLLKNNVKAEWWRAVLQERDDIVALDSAILMHPRIWEASGHLEGFTDPMVDCRTCKLRFRADKLEDAQCGRKPSDAPGRARRVRPDRAAPVQPDVRDPHGPGPRRRRQGRYLRPETAQGIFVNFKNVLQFARKKPPFGIAQIGKSFRNEITPGNFIFRTREFEQMEIEYFVPPDEAEDWHRALDGASRMRWHTDLGIRPDHLQLRKHGPDELSHYSSATSDVEYLFPMGWSELEGIANRGDFDLTRHAEFSGEKLEYFDQEKGEAYVPARDRAVAGRRPRDCSRSWSTPTTPRRSRGASAPCCASTRGSRRSRRRCCRWSRRRGCPSKAREIYEELRSARPGRVRRGRLDRQAATAARTRSAPPGESPSTARRWRTAP